MDTDESVDGLDSAGLRKKLETVNCQLNEKRHNLQTLRDDTNNFTAQKNKLVKCFCKIFTPFYLKVHTENVKPCIFCLKH